MNWLMIITLGIFLRTSVIQLLLRYIDDFLFISLDKGKAEEFLRVMFEGTCDVYSFEASSWTVDRDDRNTIFIQDIHIMDAW